MLDDQMRRRGERVGHGIEGSTGAASFDVPACHGLRELFFVDSLFVLGGPVSMRGAQTGVVTPTG